MKAIFYTLLLSLSLHARAQDKTIALTFDDLPYAFSPQSADYVAQATQNIHSILSTLQKHHAPATAFVNEGKLQVGGQMDQRVGLLELWLKAGVPLGNHTYSHANIKTMPLAEYEDDVVRGDPITRRLMKGYAMEERYFRHPFLFTGKTLEEKNALEQFLKSRGYRIAPVTMENLDWAYNTAYREALKEGDTQTAERVLAAYLDNTEIEINYYEKMVEGLFGRNIAHVMLLHSNQINALELDQVLAKFEAHGYRFVTLDEALKDPAYQSPDNYAGKFGSPWPHRWAYSMGKKPDFEEAPDPQKWVWELYKRASP